jgi:hypothetical protein
MCYYNFARGQTRKTTEKISEFRFIFLQFIIQKVLGQYIVITQYGDVPF